MEHDKEYVRMLETLPEDLRKAWLEGDWNMFVGQYFTEWNEDIHVIDPFPLPSYWRRYFTMDYGCLLYTSY